MCERPVAGFAGEVHAQRCVAAQAPTLLYLTGTTRRGNRVSPAGTKPCERPLMRARRREPTAPAHRMRWGVRSDAADERTPPAPLPCAMEQPLIRMRHPAQRLHLAATQAVGSSALLSSTSAHSTLRRSANRSFAVHRATCEEAERRPKWACHSCSSSALRLSFVLSSDSPTDLQGPVASSPARTLQRGGVGHHPARPLLVRTVEQHEARPDRCRRGRRRAD